MTVRCVRCNRRAPFPGIDTCEACLAAIQGRGRQPEPMPEPVAIPEWRRRAVGKDLTGRAA